MSEFERASVEEMAARRGLADEAVRALRLAGLPVHTRPSAGPQDDVTEPGALVLVDPDGTAVQSRVQVTWSPSDEMVEASNVALLAGDFGAAAIKMTGMVARAMQPAVAEVLRIAGFEVELSTDDMNPFAVNVITAPGSPFPKSTSSKSDS